MSIVGGGISVIDAIKSNRSFDDEIRKALEKVTDDDFQRKRLITLSSDILHFAVRKLNNEKIILPPDIDEKEFNDFFNKMLSSKETCLYLQDQLQNYKIDKLSQKLDDIYAAIKIPGLRSYKDVLDVNLKRKFLDEASENLIKEKKLYFNELYINKVKNCLDNRKDCLIKAPEGRGKTYLSRIIAYEYHHEHRMEVWFLDFKDENDANSKISIENLDDQLKAWHEFKEKNYLLVLENVHAYSDVNGLQKKIDDWIDTADNHIRFLLNARPTDEGLVDFSGWEDKMVELRPNDTDINAIINLYSEEIGRPPFASQEERGGFLKRIYPEGNNSIGANLRLLNIYLKTWQNHPEKTYISDIDEPTILKDFIKRYKLEKVTEEDIKVLHYISCIYQFDVPFHIDLIPNGRSNSLQKFKGKGLLRKVNNTYHLPHSVDALYLSKAISLYNNKENYLDEYLENTKVFVNQFVDAILASSNPGAFDDDFRLLRHGLIERKDEFRVLINELANWPMAEKIIKNIHPGFVIIAFDTRNGHPSEDILEYYNANIGWLKTSILGLTPNGLGFFCYTFKKSTKHSAFEGFFKNPEELNNYLRINEKVFYNNQSLIAISDLGRDYKRVLLDYYKQNTEKLRPSFLELDPITLRFIYLFFKSDINIVKDIFKNPDDLHKYLAHRFEINNNPSNPPRLLKGSVRKAIESISQEHAAVIKEFYNRSKNFHKINKYHFVSIEENDMQIPISNTLIHKYCEFDKTRFQQLISDLYKQGFYFDGLSWRRLSIFLKKMNDCIDETYKEVFRQVTKTFVKMIIDKDNVFLEKPNALEKASITRLSYFLFYLRRIDNALYNDTILNAKMIETVKQRLGKLGNISSKDLFLFGRFYSQNWCKTKMGSLIDNADEEQQKVIKAWHDKVLDGLKKEGKSIEQGSILDYIHNKFFNEQQNN